MGNERESRLIMKSMIKLSIAVVAFAAILFLSAGRLDWMEGWAYVGMITASTCVTIPLMDKGLIIERTSIVKGAKKWDIPLAFLMGRIIPLATLIVCGLDERLAWSWVSCALQVAASIGIVAGLVVSDWAIVENKFFSPVVHIQHERGHRVIDTGPYRYVRHPGYAGGILANVLTPLILDSWWGLIPGFFMVVVTIVRTHMEDETLHEELEGYGEYARKVKYRLLPLIW